MGSYEPNSPFKVDIERIRICVGVKQV